MPAGDAGGNNKKKGSGGIIGGLKKIGGAAVNVLGAPQQVIYGLANSVGELSRGNLADAGRALGHAGAELGTLGQIKGDWDFSRALATHEKDGSLKKIKLPKGVNTAAGFVADPLLVTGVGKGAEATKGLAKLGSITGKSEPELAALVKAGGLKKGTALRGQLEAALAGDIGAVSPKVQKLLAAGKTGDATAFAAKKAGKTGKLTARRGAGGLTAFIPGTEITLGRDIGGVAGKGLSVKKGLTKLIESTPEGKKALDTTKGLFQGAHKLTKELGSSEQAVNIRNLAGMRSAKAKAAVEDVLTDLRNATHSVGREVTDEDTADLVFSFEAGVDEIAKLVTRKPELAPLAQSIERIRKATTEGQIDAKVLDRVFDNDTYMRRLFTDEVADVAKGGTAKSQRVVSEAAGSLEGALAQKANKARSVFPEMPTKLINEMKRAVEADTPLDLKHILRQEPYAKFVKDYPPQVLETAIRDFEGFIKELPKGADIYQQDALASIIQRATTAQRAIAGAEFLQDLKGIDGGALLLDEAAVEAGKKVPAGWVTLELPHLGTFHAPPALAEEIKKVTGVIGKDGFLEEFDVAMNSWTKFWKAQATTGILGALPFATRNARSNMYLMMTEGMNPKQIGQYMKEAWKLESKVRDITGAARISDTKFIGKHADEVADKGIDAVLRSKLTAHEYELWRTMQKNDIVGTGFFQSDFGTDLAGKVANVKGQAHKARGGAVGQVTSDLLSTKGRLTKSGRAFNSTVENNARVALFMHNLDKYGDVQTAVLRTKKVLFDYGDLTAFEQRRLKQVIPFYTFMRKNLPHQLETLIENPIRVALPEKISQAQAGAAEGLADYQEEAGSRGVNPLIPFFGGAISTPDRPFQAAFDTISPLTLAATGQGKEAARALFNVPGGPQVGAVKALGEVGTGKDFFTGGNVPPGLLEAIRRGATSQLPSLARLPRVEVGGVSPTRAVTGKKAKPLPDELLKLLSGIRVDRPKG